ncbi:MAG: M14 family metallopeptidase [Acidobacteria bacterium]|nr:M14 family metallopeptidase [Acidobacteriota bacterium]
MRRLCSVLAMLVLGVTAPLAAQAPFALGGVTAAPGTLQSGTLAVPAATGDQGTTIPFSIVHGARPGPVLALIAGTHGMEYVPIVALQRLRTALDPAALAGTVVMVHVANMPSFLGRTIYYSPADGKNLNRVFPGRTDGTLSERIADMLTREVIARATHVVDIHCGDGNESLRPYVYWITTGASDVAETGRKLALASGFDHIVIDRGRPTDPAASLYLSNTAILRGKPALTVESGAMAIVDEPSIARIERAVAGWLRELGMRADGPPPVATPIWIDRSEVVTSGATGIFEPEVERGHYVLEGLRLGRVVDFHGNLLEEVRAPLAGIVLYVIGTPPISKGEPVAFIGHIQAK